MAGRDRMTVEEVVRRVLREEHADVIRESVRAEDTVYLGGSLARPNAAAFRLIPDQQCPVG